MLLDTLPTIRAMPTQMKENGLQVHYLLRNREHDYQIGQLMLCIF